MTGEPLDVGVAAVRAGISDFVRKEGAGWQKMLLEAVERGVKATAPSRRSATCFAIMPFGGDFDKTYFSIWKKAAARAGFILYRNDEGPGGPPILREIRAALKNAKVAIADTTGLNANVMYELGLAHGMRVRTLIVTQNVGELPRDVSHLHCLHYRPADPAWPKQLEEGLVRFLIEAPGFEGTDPW
jgi:hypothetical protein